MTVLGVGHPDGDADDLVIDADFERVAISNFVNPPNNLPGPPIERM